MSTNYINHIDDFKSSQVFTYLQDIDRIYNQFRKGELSLSCALAMVARMFSYLKGYLFGLDVKHINKFFFNNGDKFEYLSFYSNSSKKVKYTLCLCLNPENFLVKYTITDKI